MRQNHGQPANQRQQTQHKHRRWVVEKPCDHIHNGIFVQHHRQCNENQVKPEQLAQENRTRQHIVLQSNQESVCPDTVTPIRNSSAWTGPMHALIHPA